MTGRAEAAQTHSSARSVDPLFSQERIKNLQVDVYTHTRTRTHTYTHQQTRTPMCVRFAAHARKIYPFWPKQKIYRVPGVLKTYLQ